LYRIASRTLPTSTVRVKNSIVYCEHPTSSKERETGLKGRDFLFDNRGMLFDTYGQYRPLFTMSDVLINLEAIFVGNDMCVKDIVFMQRLNSSTAYTTSLRVPIRWVIEVNAGWCDKHNISVGDKVIL